MFVSANARILVLLSLFLAGCAGEISDAQHIENAREYLASGDNSAAVIELKGALQVNSDNAEARLLLGSLYLSLGGYADATKELGRAEELGANGDEVLPLLAQALLAQNELDALGEIDVDRLTDNSARGIVLAAQGQGGLRRGDAGAASLLIDKAVAESPRGVYPAYSLAVLLVAQSEGDFTPVRQQLQRVFELDSDYAPAWSLLGDIELRDMQIGAAEQAFTRAVDGSVVNFEERYKLGLIHIQQEDFEKARKDVIALVKQQPEHPATQYLQGRVNYQDGNYFDAIGNFEAASQYEDRFPTSLFYLAVAQAREGNLIQANASASRYLAPEPSSVPGRKLLATIRLEVGDAVSAEELARPLIESDDEDVDALNIVATALLAQGKTEEGTALLARIVELQPDSAEAISRFGAGLLVSGETSRGIEQIETALDLDPQLQASELLLISAHLRQANFDAALEAIDAFEQKYPEGTAPENLRGSVYLKSGNIEAAEEAFARALKVSPEDPAANHNLALLALKSGDVERARGFYDNVLLADADHLESLLNLAALSERAQDYSSMVGYLERAISAHPQDIRPRIFLARYYLVHRQFDKVPLVLSELDASARRHPDVVNLEGLTQLESGQYAAAKDSFIKLIALRPDASQPHYHLAMAYRGLGDTSRMTVEFEKAIEISPAYVNPRIDFARAMLEVRDMDAVLTQLEYLRKLAPSNPEVIQLDAIRARFDGDQEEALRLSEMAFEISPSARNLLILSRQLLAMGRRDQSSELLESWVEQHPADLLARQELTGFYESIGDHAQAVAQYKLILVHDSDNVTALNNLAWNLRETDPEQALEYADRAVAIDPDSYSALDTLAVIQYNRKQYDEAQRMIEKALRQDASNPEMRYHSAMISAAAGHRDTALAILTALLEEKAEFPAREEAMLLQEKLQ